MQKCVKFQHGVHMLYVKSRKIFELKFQIEHNFAYKPRSFLHNSLKMFPFLSIMRDKMCKTHSIFFTTTSLCDIMRY
jgi:hypothetical protein